MNTDIDRKIVFVIPDMPGGGTERVVALLANEYAGRGIAVTILLFAGHQTAYSLWANLPAVRSFGGSRESGGCGNITDATEDAVSGHLALWGRCSLLLHLGGTGKNMSFLSQSGTILTAMIIL